MKGAQTTLMIAVSPGGTLPVIGGFITVKSHLTGYEYAVRVSSIRSLRWLPTGEIEVTVRGTKGVVQAPAEREAAHAN